MTIPTLILAIPQSPLEIIGGITTAIFATWAAFRLTAKLGWFGGEEPENPKLAGTEIPELGEGLDLAKRYDVIYGGDYHSNFSEKLQCVRIVGYVGEGADGSKMYMRGRWLAFESENGSRSYVMPHAIVSLQETSSGN